MTALGAYGYILSLVNSHATILNALNINKRMIVFGWSEAALNLGISLVLVNILGIGGVALGMFLATLLTVFWMLPIEICLKTDKKIRLNIRPVITHTIIVMLPCLFLVLMNSIFIDQLYINILASVCIIALYFALAWLNTPLELRRIIKTIMILRQESCPKDEKPCES